MDKLPLLDGFSNPGWCLMHHKIQSPLQTACRRPMERLGGELGEPRTSTGVCWVRCPQEAKILPMIAFTFREGGNSPRKQRWDCSLPVQ